MPSLSEAANQPEPEKARQYQGSRTEGLRTLRPTDESPRLPSFRRFRAKLERAIADRDVGFVRSLIDKDIKYTLGMDPVGEKLGAREGFFAEHDLKRGRRSQSSRPSEAQARFWLEFHNVLRHGCARSGPNEVICPSMSAKWPTELDPYEHVLALGSKVPVREKASEKARVIMQVAYDILRRSNTHGESLPEGWTEVDLEAQNSEGKADDNRGDKRPRRGYISAKDAWSPVGYRVSFEEQDGKWRIKAFIAGD